MAHDDPSSIRTRPSLLDRLKTGDDTEGWKEFYRIYGKLVRDFALRAGLTQTEADEVVQDTAVAMARHLPDYRYDPKVCRFKTWLLNQAAWRVKDQFKKRRKHGPDRVEPLGSSPPAGSADDTGRTSTANRVPDPSAADLDEIFEVEWRKSLLARAVEQVRDKFTLKQFQVFDLVVLREWPAAKVARLLGLSLANIYVIRHRMSAAVRKQAKLLEIQLEQAERARAAQSDAPGLRRRGASPAPPA